MRDNGAYFVRPLFLTIALLIHCNPCYARETGELRPPLLLTITLSNRSNPHRERDNRADFIRPLSLIIQESQSKSQSQTFFPESFFLDDGRYTPEAITTLKAVFKTGSDQLHKN
jgi:hypothetical protein